MVKVLFFFLVLGVLFSVPFMVVPTWLLVVVEVLRGKFWRRFGLVSGVMGSLALALLGVRSMPSSPLEWMEFERMRLPVLLPLSSLTPSKLWKAMVFAALVGPSLGSESPMVLLDELKTTTPKVSSVARSAVPFLSVPMRLPW